MTFAIGVNGSMQFDVASSFGARAYRVSLYCNDVWKITRTQKPGVRLSPRQNATVEFEYAPESGTNVQLVLEGSRNNGRPFYLLLEGVMP